MNLDEYERLQPNMDYTPSGCAPLKFLIPNNHCAWRVSTLDTKEPDTIDWLVHMRAGEMLFDVGANMGQYSLIAARRGVRVHAFEPESQNFALLCRNVGINELNDLVMPWPLCLSDDNWRLDTFYSQSLKAGGSCNSFGDSVNFHLQPKQYRVRQGGMAVTMHDFAQQFGMPDHVKIDVDGIEHKIVAGMGSVLETVKSVLVEINTALPEHLAIFDTMEANGLLPDLETADAARRTEGAFAGIGNVIFYRDGKRA